MMNAISASLDNRVVSYTTVNIMMNAISASLDNKVVYYTVNIMMNAILNKTKLNFSLRYVYDPKRSKHAKIMNMGSYH